MKKQIKLFISHHHEDAASLSKFKKTVKNAGCKAFLAHADIEPGEHDLECIEKEIIECDLFLYIASKKANDSFFCQQEIGMAKALNKKIIPVTKDGNLPKGFIARLQAKKCQDLDVLYEHIYEHLPQNNIVKKHLKKLNCKGFSKIQKTMYIYLNRNNFNDYRFQTIVDIFLNNQKIGITRIAFQNIQISNHPLDTLPAFFSCLSENYFSRVAEIEDSLTEEQKNSLLYLLNDVSLIPTDKIQNIYKMNKSVFKDSLFRDDTASLNKAIGKP